MRFSVLLCGLLFAANIQASERQISLDWLKTMVFAAHQADYDGVFVYQYGRRVETSRITHVTEADNEYERLESLDGPRREIIRYNGQIWSYNNHKMEPVDSRHGRGRFPSLLPEQLSALSENYHAWDAGEERVAGYNAQVILFHPRDNLRYAHKMWAHTDSGLLLKAAVLGDKNQVVEQYAFTQLQIGGNIDRSWAAARDAASARNHADSKRANSGWVVGAPNKADESRQVNSGWVVDAMPAGFKKTMEVLRPMRGRHAPVTQLVFSDGLSAISVFVEPSENDEDDVEGLSSRGAVNFYRKVVDDHLITVVGEVPPRTVMQVLGSVRRNVGR